MGKVKKRAKEIQHVEMMPGVYADKRSVSWFISKMFNPEENIWVWIRRIANILTIPILVILLILLFK